MDLVLYCIRGPHDLAVMEESESNMIL